MAKSRQRQKFDRPLISKEEIQSPTTNIGDTNIDRTKWVMNLSDRPLSDSERSVLMKGLNFSVTPSKIPVDEIVTATELASDTGRTTVILNKQDYHNKVKALLDDTNTYEKLTSDPTRAIKNKLIQTLKEWRKEERIPNYLYNQLYPTAENVPKFYGLPKIHKKDVPLRPIVSSIGSVMYDTAKFLAKIMKPLVGLNSHHIVNSEDFVNKIAELEVPPGQKLVSYDVSSHCLPAFRSMKPFQLSEPNWEFTSEQEKDGRIPFLDTCVSINQDGSTKISVYRKPTHTDQYLNFQSNHHLQHKRAVVNTLMLRAQTLVTENEDRTRETQHVKQALKMNNYPEWMLTIPHPKSTTEDTEEPQNEKKIYASTPYIKGISERLQRAFKSHDVTLIHKPVNSLRSQLVRVKDTTVNLKKCGTVYQIHCEKCNKEYVGETARALEIRVKEHQSRSSSAVHEHCRLEGHSVDPNKTKVLSTEVNTFKRRIKEAIQIKLTKPALNRDNGYELAAIYDTILTPKRR
ncbi:uncharacterized protein [Pocillopora verrucosa]|uniref:uncharacterized protein n=1 Tax=Pocillopora verrucosa TaxID=203993 RepID=UPI003341F8D2